MNIEQIKSTMSDAIVALNDADLCGLAEDLESAKDSIENEVGVWWTHANNLAEALGILSKDFVIFRKVCGENGISGTFGNDSLLKANQALSEWAKHKGESK